MAFSTLEAYDCYKVIHCTVLCSIPPSCLPNQNPVYRDGSWSQMNLSTKHEAHLHLACQPNLTSCSCSATDSPGPRTNPVTVLHDMHFSPVPEFHGRRRTMRKSANRPAGSSRRQVGPRPRSGTRPQSRRLKGFTTLNCVHFLSKLDIQKARHFN
jgi:hypothetical protein